MRGIYLITDSLELLREVVDTGISAVQYRDKPGVHFEKARTMRALCQTYGIPFIVNDRVDLALLLDADGVHLGQTAFPVTQARRLLKRGKIVGGTLCFQGVDYVGVGHIFPTTTKKKEGAPLGIAKLEEICQRTPLPVVAVGGIRPEHIPAIRRAGASAAAVSSAISNRESAIRLVDLWGAPEFL